MKTSATTFARIMVFGAVLAMSTAAVGQVHPNQFDAPLVCTDPTTNMTASVLYAQIPLLCDIGSWSENHDATNITYTNETADDFVVSPQGWEVTQVEIMGGPWQSPYPDASYNITFYNDNAGSPGSVKAQHPSVPPTVLPATNPGRGPFLFDIPPQILEPGAYWISVQANDAEVNPGGTPFHIRRFQWFLTDSPGAGVSGNESHFRNNGSVVPACTGPNWFAAGACYGVGPFDVAFQLGGRALPVELVSFDAVRSDSDVLLRWTTASETNNAGFDIEHAVGDDDFSRVGFVEGHGTTLIQQEYSFRVAGLAPGVHRFRLKQVDFDGAFEYSETVETFVGIPGQMVLEPAYPNPFNPSTTIRFAVANEQHVSLALHDATGRFVRSVFSGVVGADDMHSVTVDATGLASGLYVAVLSGESVSMSRNLLLSK